MPFTIENDINATLVALQIGGPAAVAARQDRPIIDPSGLQATPRVAQAPRNKVLPPPTVPLDVNERYKSIISTWRTTSTPLIRTALAKLCASPAEIERPTAATKIKIEVYEQARPDLDLGTAPVDGVLDRGDISYLSDATTPACTGPGVRNFYESAVLGGDIMASARSLVPALNRKLPPELAIPDNADEARFRQGVSAFQDLVSARLTLKGPSLRGQITPELYNLIFE